MQFLLLSSDDSKRLSLMVQEKLNSGWVLYGSPSTAIGASPTSSKIQHKLFSQAVVKQGAEPQPAFTEVNSDNPSEDSEGNKAQFVYESPDDKPDHISKIELPAEEEHPEPAAVAEVTAPAEEASLEEQPKEEITETVEEKVAVPEMA